MFERGRESEKGLCPLSLKLLSPANKSTGLKNITGWRGDKGERQQELLYST
jgi:hypothetical protein